jgi:WG repeat protein
MCTGEIMFLRIVMSVRLCLAAASTIILCSCLHPSQGSPSSPDAIFSHNRLLVTVDGKTGFVDRSGKLAITPQWDEAFRFTEGLALVCVGECDADHRLGYRLGENLHQEPLEQTFKYGYVDESGRLAINPTYEAAGLFHEGVAAVCLGKGCYSSYPKKEGLEAKWGYIDRAGRTLISPQFDSAGEFHEGLASVSVGGKYGYIDKAGQFVVNPQYYVGLEFNDGVAQVGVKIEAGKDTPAQYKFGYIDKTGRFIWQPSN